MRTDRADMRNLCAALSTSGGEGADPGVSPRPSHPLGHYLTLHLISIYIQFLFCMLYSLKTSESDSPCLKQALV